MFFFFAFVLSLFSGYVSAIGRDDIVLNEEEVRLYLRATFPGGEEEALAYYREGDRFRNQASKRSNNFFQYNYVPLNLESAVNFERTEGWVKVDDAVKDYVKNQETLCREAIYLFCGEVGDATDEEERCRKAIFYTVASEMLVGDLYRIRNFEAPIYLAQFIQPDALYLSGERHFSRVEHPLEQLGVAFDQYAPHGTRPFHLLLREIISEAERAEPQNQNNSLTAQFLDAIPRGEVDFFQRAKKLLNEGGTGLYLILLPIRI